jgi:dihydroflavonol-4-reductase
MYEINVQGTINVMTAARNAGVERVVYTSSVGALAATDDGRPLNEEAPVRLNDMVGTYKKTKFMAEREVYRFIEGGLPVVIVNPSAPIGAMDIKPTPTGRIIVDFLNGRLPAYLETGLNFTDVEDVACGHWLACMRGRVGEKYILGNLNMSLGDFLETLAAVSGRKARCFRLPYLPVLASAYVSEFISAFTKRPPVIPLAGVKMAKKFMYFDSSKAVRELGLPQHPIEGAIAKAISWFEQNGYVMKRSVA